MSALAEPVTAYFRAVEAFDLLGARDHIVELLDEGMPMDQITTEVLAPAQIRVGQLWESGRWSVADEHAATSITEAALSALTHAAMPRRGAHRHHLAVACVEGEWNSLPARMAATVAATHDVGVPVVVGGRALGDTPLRAWAIGADGGAVDPKVLLDPPPALAGRSSEISTEVLLLDAVDEAIVTLAFDRTVDAFLACRT